MTALNDEIRSDRANLGHGFEIGHSYFVPQEADEPDRSWYETADLEAEKWSGITDLFAQVLIRLVSALLRRGMHRAYLSHSGPLRGLSGTVDIPTTVKRGLPARRELPCEYDELSHDTASNRIIKAVLLSIMRAAAVEAGLLKGVEALYRRLAHVGQERQHAGLFRTIQVHRNNRLYRFVLDVCRLVCECQVPSERAGTIRFVDFRRDEATMRRLQVKRAD